jgi:N-acetylneuraminic acid mutarotase
MYLPQSKESTLTLEELHSTIKEALGKQGEIIKIMLDDIFIRNINGIKFMFKKPDPKLEVVFETIAGGHSHLHHEPVVNSSYNFQAPVVPVSVSVTPTTSKDNKWLIVLEKYPYSFGHTAVNINEHLFVFGGFADDLTTNHCLLLSDIKGGKFSKLKTRGDLPPIRERHSLSIIGKKLYLFGGYCRGSETYYDTIYLFESETLTWTKIDPRGNPPECRCGHSASVIDGRIWIFGGRAKPKYSGFFDSDKTGLIYKNDLHCYDPATNEWLRYEPRGIGPSGRALHTATVVGRKIYIFGGANSTGHRNDTTGFCDLYELDIDTMSWVECEAHGTPPSPCYGHTANYIGDNRILYYGGKGYQVLNDIHILNLYSMEWKQYAYAGNTLSPRWGHSVTLHDTKIVIYGGRASHGYYNTMDIIDTSKELIELAPEEQYKEKQKRKNEEKNKTSEALGNLQTTTGELTELTNHLGEQLLLQKKAIHETRNAMMVLLQENESLKQHLQSIAPNYFLNQPPPVPRYDSPLSLPPRGDSPSSQSVRFESSNVYSESQSMREEKPTVDREENYLEEGEMRRKEVKSENVVGNNSTGGERGSGNNSAVLMGHFGAGSKLHVFPPPPSPVFAGPKETVTTNDDQIISY